MATSLAAEARALQVDMRVAGSNLTAQAGQFRKEVGKLL